MHWFWCVFDSYLWFPLLSSFCLVKTRLLIIWPAPTPTNLLWCILTSLNSNLSQCLSCRRLVLIHLAPYLPSFFCVLFAILTFSSCVLTQSSQILCHTSALVWLLWKRTSYKGLQFDCHKNRCTLKTLYGGRPPHHPQITVALWNLF